MSVTVSITSKSRFVVYCDFCGATEHEAKTLIAAPRGPHICDECVKVSMDIVSQREDTALRTGGTDGAA